MIATGDMVKTFHRDGYLYAGRVLSAKELAAAQAAYDRILKSEEKPKSYRELATGDGGPDTALTMCQVVNMYQLDPIFERIIMKSTLVDIAEALIGTSNIHLYHDQAIYKPAFHGGESPWHQDNGYWKLEPATAVSCWLALDDVDLENGCMWVIPGSHRSGTSGHSHAGPASALLKLTVDDRNAVPLPMPAGCAMFHHCQTLHHTKSNLTPHQRRALAIHYMAAESLQNGKPLENRLALRGAPTDAAKR